MNISSLNKNSLDALLPKSASPVYDLISSRGTGVLGSTLMNSAGDMTLISQQAKKAGDIYNEIKKTGNTEAASAFRSALVSFANNGDVTGMNNFMEFGTTLVGQNKTGLLNETLTVAEGLNKIGAAKTARSFLNTAATTFNKLGEGSLSGLNSAANALVKLGSSEGTQAGGLVTSAMSGLIEGFNRIQNLNTTDQEKKNRLSELSQGVKVINSLEKANEYIKEQLTRIGEAEKAMSKSKTA